MPVLVKDAGLHAQRSAGQRDGAGLLSVPSVVRFKVAPLSTVTVPALASRPTLATSVVSLLPPMVTASLVLLVRVPVTSGCLRRRPGSG